MRLVTALLLLVQRGVSVRRWGLRVHLMPVITVIIRGLLSKLAKRLLLLLLTLLSLLTTTRILVPLLLLLGHAGVAAIHTRMVVVMGVMMRRLVGVVWRVAKVLRVAGKPLLLLLRSNCTRHGASTSVWHWRANRLGVLLLLLAKVIWRVVVGLKVGHWARLLLRDKLFCVLLLMSSLCSCGWGDTWRHVGHSVLLLLLLVLGQVSFGVSIVLRRRICLGVAHHAMVGKPAKLLLVVIRRVTAIVVLLVHVLLLLVLLMLLVWAATTLLLLLGNVGLTTTSTTTNLLLLLRWGLDHGRSRHGLRSAALLLERGRSGNGSSHGSRSSRSGLFLGSRRGRRHETSEKCLVRISSGFFLPRSWGVNIAKSKL